jgi:predicted MFS family arabinose efflux permease
LSDLAEGGQSTIKGFREWMALSLMLSGGVMLALVVAAMSPVAHDVAQYFAGSGDGDLIAQSIVTVPSIGIIIGGPLSGWAIASMGPKRYMLMALALFGAAGSAGLYLDSAVGLLVSRFILGLATSGIVTAMITMIGQYYSPAARARILGYQSSSGALAGVIVIKLAGWLGEYGGWRAPFALYLLALPVLLLGVAYLPVVRIARSPVASVSSENAAGSGLLSLWPIYLTIIPMFIAVYMPNIQVSFLLRDDGVVSPSAQSNVILAGAVAVAVAAPFYGSAKRILGTALILMLCFLLQGAGIVAMGLMHRSAWTALGCFILGLGTGISNPLISDLIVARAAPELRSKAIGLSYTARYGGDFLNPWIMRPLASVIGLHRAFTVVGALFLAGVGIAAMVRQAAFARKPAEAIGEQGV